MSNQAPVCLIEPILSQDQPPPVNFPSIPQATDLQSALAAINAMAGILRTITGQTGNRSGTTQFRGGTLKGGGFKVKQSPKSQTGRFVEQKPKRVTKEVTVASSQDPSTTLTFKRIDSLTFQDIKTKELWNWQR